MFRKSILRRVKGLICTLTIVSSLYAKEVSLLLIRHGETNWNAEKRAQGHSDIPLNEKGIEQAKATAEKLFQEHSDIIAIYSIEVTYDSENILKPFFVGSR